MAALSQGFQLFPSAIFLQQKLHLPLLVIAKGDRLAWQRLFRPADALHLAPVLLHALLRQSDRLVDAVLPPLLLAQLVQADRFLSFRPLLLRFAAADAAPCRRFQSILVRHALQLSLCLQHALRCALLPCPNLLLTLRDLLRDRLITRQAGGEIFRQLLIGGRSRHLLIGGKGKMRLPQLLQKTPGLVPAPFLLADCKSQLLQRRAHLFLLLLQQQEKLPAMRQARLLVQISAVCLRQLAQIS